MVKNPMGCSAPSRGQKTLSRDLFLSPTDCLEASREILSLMDYSAPSKEVWCDIIYLILSFQECFSALRSGAYDNFDNFDDEDEFLYDLGNEMEKREDFWAARG